MEVDSTTLFIGGLPKEYKKLLDTKLILEYRDIKRKLKKEKTQLTLTMNNNSSIKICAC